MLACAELIMSETELASAPPGAEAEEPGAEPKAGENTSAGCPFDIDFSVEHPLLREWVMWYDNPGGRRAWNADRFKQIHEFSTVENFWRMYNNIKAPSEISNGSNYHMFLNGVKPMWEDEFNSRGGKWIVIFPKREKELYNEYWISVLLSVIGESIAGVEAVAGCVASVRKSQNKIAVWTTDASKEVNMSIGRHMREQLMSNPDMWKSCKIEYQQHNDATPPPPPLYTL